MRSYYRVTLGVHSGEALADGFIGADYGIAEDFSNLEPEEWQHFNSTFIPKFLAKYPNKTKIAAGLAGGFIWHIACGIKNGDVVLCQDDAGNFHAGEVNGDFYYKAGHPLPHRRPVHWFNETIDRSDMSEGLRRSLAGGAVVSLRDYAEEVTRLIGNSATPKLLSSDETVEDPSAFAMETHLQEFLCENWAQTELGKEFDIFVEEGVRVGKQYRTDTGPLDILAISKDKKRLLVVELKKGRASDTVVGQILRYMGFVKQELAEEGQTVHGAIIALEDDPRIRRALAMLDNVQFYRYQVSFKLVKS